MTLKKDEINVGVVAYFSTSALKELGLLQEADLENNLGMRPFVCLSASDGKSEWYAITRRKSPFRQKIYESWRLGGSNEWATAPQYFNDLRQGIVSIDADFVAASANERDFRGNRPKISLQAIPAILTEMKKVGGSLSV